MYIHLNQPRRHSRPAMRGRRNRRRDALMIGALGALAVIMALIWLLQHLLILAGVALLVGAAYHLGQRRRARPGQAAAPRASQAPEMPAAGPAAPMVALPRADPARGQDEAPDGAWDQRGTRQPASVPAGPDRDSLLADPLSGAHPLWRPS